MTIHFKYILQKINSFFMKFCHIFIITIHIFNNLVFSLYYFGCSNLYFRFRYGFTCCINKRFNFYNFTFLEVFTEFGNVQKGIYNFNFYDLHCVLRNVSLPVFIMKVFLESAYLLRIFHKDKHENLWKLICIWILSASFINYYPNFSVFIYFFWNFCKTSLSNWFWEQRTFYATFICFIINFSKL